LKGRKLKGYLFTGVKMQLHGDETNSYPNKSWFDETNLFSRNRRWIIETNSLL